MLHGHIETLVAMGKAMYTQCKEHGGKVQK